jgi:hypothetical protein
MLRVNDKWFECEVGHVTAGNERSKKKCGAELWQLNYVKGKRKGSWITEKEKVKPCDKPIVKEGEIPKELDYTQVWDFETMHPFLIGQKFDAEFLIGLQRIISELYADVERLREKVYGKDAGRMSERVRRSEESSGHRCLAEETPVRGSGSAAVQGGQEKRSNENAT